MNIRAGKNGIGPSSVVGDCDIDDQYDDEYDGIASVLVWLTLID